MCSVAFVRGSDQIAHLIKPVGIPEGERSFLSNAFRVWSISLGVCTLHQLPFFSGLLVELLSVLDRVRG